MNIFGRFSNHSHISVTNQPFNPPLGNMPRSLFLDEQAPVEQTSTRGERHREFPMNEDVGGTAVILLNTEVFGSFLKLCRILSIIFFPKKFMAGQPTPP